IDWISNWPSIIRPTSLEAVEPPADAAAAARTDVDAAEAATISAAPQSGQNRPDSSVSRSQAEQVLTDFERSSPWNVHDCEIPVRDSGSLRGRGGRIWV